MRAEQARWRPWLRVAQIAGTLALSVVLARSIDWGQFAAALAGVRWGYIGLTALLLLFAHVMNLLRWSGLLPRNTLTAQTLIAYYGAGLFSNNFLPTGVGGDGVRAALVGRHLPLSHAMLSVALDRGIGLLGLGFFALPGLWFGIPAALAGAFVFPERAERWLFPAATIAVLTMAVMGALFVWKGSFFRRLLTRLRSGSAESPLAKGGLRGWISLLARTFFLSVWSNFGTIGAHWAVFQALGLTASPGAAIWVVLISSLSMLLPISINGLGVLESVFVVVLAAYGVPAPAALAVAVLVRALGMLFSLLGGLLSLRPGGHLAGDATTLR